MVTPNTPPTVSDIPDQFTPADTSRVVDFVVGDAQDAPEALVVTAASSDTNVVQSVVVTGTRANRTATIFPALHEIGTATVTITVRDRVGAETVDRFVVNVGLVQAQPSLALTAPSTAAVGEPLTATAALTGGTNPTGTINFRVHGPSDPTCTQDPVFSAPRTVTGNGSYTTPPFTPTASGAHRWVATYGGDANNQQAATACGAAGTTTVVQPPIAQADLFMSKSCLPSAVHAGEAVVCTVRVTNDGPAAAADVVLVDDVPSGLAITTAPTSDGLTCAVQGIDPEIRCTTATVADAATVVVSYGLTVPSDAAAGTGYASSAKVSAATVDPDLDNNVRSVAVFVVGEPTLELAAGSAELGGEIGLTVTLAGGVLPEGLLTLRTFGPDDPTCSGPADFIALVDVAGNGTYESPTYAPDKAGTYRWLAVYSGDQTNDGAVSACGSEGSISEVQPPIAQADLSVTKQCEPADLVPGDDVTCTVSIRNAGPLAATDIVAVDTVPDGLDLAAAPTGDGFTCDGDAEPMIHITCTLATLTVGSTAVFAYPLAVPTDAQPGTTYASIVEVSSLPGDPNLTDNSAPESIGVRRCTIDARTATVGQRLNGTKNADVICGSAFADRVRGAGGDDILLGSGGNDDLAGDAGADHLVGGPGADQLAGGAGADVIDARDGIRDVVSCGAGNDLALVDLGLDTVSACERVLGIGGLRAADVTGNDTGPLNAAANQPAPRRSPW